ncbi:Flp family type IVb pilin [Desulfosarcina ovata]|nr:Flp family type IVb pilin [Desulfosarcina ovata]
MQIFPCLSHIIASKKWDGSIYKLLSAGNERQAADNGGQSIKTQPAEVYSCIFSKGARMKGNPLIAFWKDESGVTAVEYGLIAGVMAALLVAVLGLFGDNLKELFEAISETLSDATDVVKNGSSEEP